MAVSLDPDYEEFRTFPHRGAAESFSSWLQFEGVPSFVEPRTLGNAVEAEFVVYALKKLAHRARWITSQLPPTDAELDYLATGKLPTEEGK